MKRIDFLIIVFIFSLTGCVSMQDHTAPLQTVDHVDLNKYTGEWYEIARYPNRFQKDCPASKATYSLLQSGKIEVLNECYDPGYQNVLRSVTGNARIVDKSTNAKLKVTFFWPFSGDYWIIELGDNYEYAVVGHPDRKYLWILSRTPEMSEELYGRISEGLKEQGYDPGKLIRR